MLIEINLSKLERGTHIGRVKVQRGGKTFWRKQRVGVKETEKEGVINKTPVGMSLKEFLNNPIDGFVFDPKLDDEGIIARRSGTKTGTKTFLSEAWFGFGEDRQKMNLSHEMGHDLLRTDDYNVYYVDVLAPFKKDTDAHFPEFENFFGASDRPEEIIADVYAAIWNPGLYYGYESAKVGNLLKRVVEVAKKRKLPLPDGIDKKLNEQFQIN